MASCSRYGIVVFFFFSSRRRHTRCSRDWSSDVCSSDLEPIRKALKSTRPAGKAAAHQKYWQELLGQAGGAVRAPLLALTEPEKAATRARSEERRVGKECRCRWSPEH